MSALAWWHTIVLSFIQRFLFASKLRTHPLRGRDGRNQVSGNGFCLSLDSFLGLYGSQAGKSATYEWNHMNRRQLQATHLILLAILVTCLSSSPALAFDNELPPYTDYCEMLAQEIQGRKHAFLAGNLTYYVGGRYDCWRRVEDETIGLTHPFHHDLRGRGFGLAKHPGSGFGHDFRGWEKIHLEIDPSGDQPFALMLRIPTWAREQFVPGELYHYIDDLEPKWTLKVNG